VANVIPIERGKIREFARATGSRNPDYDRRDAPVPPTFLTTARAFWTVEQADLGIDFDLARLLHGEEEYEFVGPPPHAGEELTFEVRIGDRWEKEGKRGGRMRFAQMITEFRDSNGNVRAIQRTTLLETAKAPS
jgi:hypothetical protein